MRILVTGAAGRIGRCIVQQLRDQPLPGQASPAQVLGLDRLPSPTTDLLADLGDLALLRQALQGVDAVVHSAALHAPHVGQLPDSEFERINVQGTRQLAEAAVAAGVRQLVFTSTTALYGAAAAPGEAAQWVDEALAPLPRSIYHRSKLAAEAALARLAQQHSGLAVTVLRMSRCFPEPAPLMAAYRLHRGVDARDVAAAHALALARPQPGWRCFVVSGATPFLPADAEALGRDAAALLRRRAPALVEAFHQRGWPLPARIDRVYSPAKAQQQLGWQPQHGVDEVLRQLDAGAAEVLPA